MKRATLALVLAAWMISPAFAQTQAEAELSLRIQQLEEQLRRLTGENERLTYELNQARAQLGLPPVAAAGSTVPDANAQVPGSPQVVGQTPAEPPATVGTIAPPATNDPNAPVDIGRLAEGDPLSPDFGNTPAPLAPDTTVQPAAVPAAPPVQALSGSPRDEYDLAYGYILTGDYDLAEASFKVWIDSFPSDPLAPDAEFWLGESHLQQGEYKDAATAFLHVYKLSPDGQKGPDSLLKLGISLSALGEQSTACSTFAEFVKRYPQASESIMSRVRDEASRAGC